MPKNAYFWIKSCKIAAALGVAPLLSGGWGSRPQTLALLLSRVRF